MPCRDDFGGNKRLEIIHWILNIKKEKDVKYIENLVAINQRTIAGSQLSSRESFYFSSKKLWKFEESVTLKAKAIIYHLRFIGSLLFFAFVLLVAGRFGYVVNDKLAELFRAHRFIPMFWCKPEPRPEVIEEKIFKSRQ